MSIARDSGWRSTLVLLALALLAVSPAWCADQPMPAVATSPAAAPATTAAPATAAADAAAPADPAAAVADGSTRVLDEQIQDLKQYS